MNDRPSDPQADPRPIDEQVADTLLARALRRAWWTILWERLWPALASLAVAIGIFLAASWAGLWLWLPPLGRAVALFVYAIICGSQIRMRRRLEATDPGRLKLRMWGYPWLSWVTLVLTLVVVASMLFVDADARSQLYLSLISLAVILAVYALIRRRSDRDSPRVSRDPARDSRD